MTMFRGKSTYHYNYSDEMVSALDSGLRGVRAVRAQTLLLQSRTQGLFKITEEKSMGTRFLLPNVVSKALPNQKRKALETRLPTWVSANGHY